MAELIVVLLIIAAVLGVVVVSGRRSRAAAQARQRAELEPVEKLAFEDITALGEELQRLDADLLGEQLDAGARADYQRALDDYEAAKTAGGRLAKPEDLTHVVEILDDGRYAIACVRARVAGQPLPIRRPPCFFDPRHGLSVTDVSWAPPGGAVRQVPACALDAERVTAGADPDVRKVMVGSQRVPYWEGGPAFRPYAVGYYGGFGPMDLMFAGMLFGGLGGFDVLGGIGDGIGDGIGEIGDGIGDVFDGGFDF